MLGSLRMRPKQLFILLFASLLLMAGTRQISAEGGHAGGGGVAHTVAAPLAPSGLKAERSGTGFAVTVRWTDSSSDELDFQISSRPPGGAWALDAIVPANVTSFTYQNHPTGSYEYRVIACGSGACSSDSNIATLTIAVMTPPPPPPPPPPAPAPAPTPPAPPTPPASTSAEALADKSAGAAPPPSSTKATEGKPPPGVITPFLPLLPIELPPKPATPRPAAPMRSPEPARAKSLSPAPLPAPVPISPESPRPSPAPPTAERAPERRAPGVSSRPPRPAAPKSFFLRTWGTFLKIFRKE